jgi:putative flippase GtrA
VTDQETLSPGEARTKARQRRQIIYFCVAMLIGALIGFFTGFFDQGDGNLFAGDWEDLSLPPAVSIGIAIGVLFGFLILPLWGFTQIDDYKREQNYISFTGGMHGVLAGFPIWAVLYAGGFAPPPHAFGIWAIGFVSMAVAYLYAWWTR